MSVFWVHCHAKLCAHPGHAERSGAESKHLKTLNCDAYQSDTASVVKNLSQVSVHPPGSAGVSPASVRKEGHSPSRLLIWYSFGREESVSDW